ncbi:MAG: peroxiredoxin family protein [Methanospirillum sp.]|nr:peroxiredoxin family protein [Methanospirillum sp.]
MNNIRSIFRTLGVILVLGIAALGCQAEDTNSAAFDTPVKAEVTSSGETAPELAWLSSPLVNVATKERFTLKELASQGKPVIINSFAVWCPGCSMQLLESTKLLTTYPDDYIVVALDIDPNENADKVKRHQESNQFKGIFTTATTDVTRSLVNAYGPGFALEIPQTIIITGKTATYLEDGVFTADTLKRAADELRT